MGEMAMVIIMAMEMAMVIIMAMEMEMAIMAMEMEMAMVIIMAMEMEMAMVIIMAPMIIMAMEMEMAKTPAQINVLLRVTRIVVLSAKQIRWETVAHLVPQIIIVNLVGTVTAVKTKTLVQINVPMSVTMIAVQNVTLTQLDLSA